MKIKFKIILLCLLTVSLVACGNGGNGGSGGNEEKGSKAAENAEVKKPKLEMSIKDYGIITMELEPECAPITVENFVNLVNEKFYDGLTFTRVVPGQMILGGDPTKDGKGAAKASIKGEFEHNGINNPLKHVRGAVVMARLENDYDSASSQFYIMQQDYPDLDGACAVFGNVTSGMEIVDKICEEVSTDEYGQVDFMEQPIIDYIKVIE